MKMWRMFFLLILLIAVAVGLYHTGKTLPNGVNVAYDSHLVRADSVEFLADRTYLDEDRERVVEQEIFDEVFAMIAGAREYVLVDMFLFNSFQGNPPETTRALSEELTEALLEKKRERPEILMTVVTDPINEVYGGTRSEHLEALREAGVEVVVTDLSRLRDSNPIYSSFWRMFIDWAGNFSEGGKMPHPLHYQGENVSLRSWLRLLNLKANHRKLMVADVAGGRGQRLATLVTSGNPHDGSSAHGNVAVKIIGSLGQDVIASEQAVGAFSGGVVPSFDAVPSDDLGIVTVQLLTERAIKDRLLELIVRTDEGDTIDMLMFYLADRDVVRALTDAGRRGVRLRFILDPSKDAFGRKKIGVPNRPVAEELVAVAPTAVQVRWCDTHGEQCHGKMTLFKIDGRRSMVLGSANLTRRNLDNYNLETNVLVEAGEDVEVLALDDAMGYFEELWNNRDGKLYTTGYEAYAEGLFWKSLVYRIQEAWGVGSF